MQPPTVQPLPGLAAPGTPPEPVTCEASTDQAPLVRPAPWTFGLSSSGMHASDRRPVSPPRPVDGSMTCAKITFSVDGDAGHGGLCVRVNRAPWWR
jgi:hypothetical protein